MNQVITPKIRPRVLCQRLVGGFLVSLFPYVGFLLMCVPSMELEKAKLSVLLLRRSEENLF